MTFREYKRRGLLPVLVVALALFYLLVSEPWALRSARLDEQLRKPWRTLATYVGQPTNATVLDFQQITNQLHETRQELNQLDTAKKEVLARFSLPPELKDRLSNEFRNASYERERTRRKGELEKNAKAQQVTLEDKVILPENNFELNEPRLLWPALDFADNLLDSAVKCKVSTIHLLEVTLSPTNSLRPDAATRWSKIPLELEFTAPAENALKFLQSLPLKPAEIHAAGLFEARPGKVPLLIEHLVIKKQNPEKLDEVRVWLQVAGFIWQGAARD